MYCQKISFATKLQTLFWIKLNKISKLKSHDEFCINNIAKFNFCKWGEDKQFKLESLAHRCDTPSNVVNYWCCCFCSLIWTGMHAHDNTFFTQVNKTPINRKSFKKFTEISITALLLKMFSSDCKKGIC